MPFSTDTDDLARLEARLQQRLPKATFARVPLGESIPALLVLQDDYLVAAFAWGTTESSYDDMYHGFKREFTTHRSSWENKDLAFVFCLSKPHHITEEFRSRVEVDVYFCRKFVVLLDQNLDAALAALPFLPLSPVLGASARPPSAQALLQSQGVPAELSKILVAPGKGASQILADCLSGKYGPSYLSRTSLPPPGPTRLHTAPRSTLNSIAIRNFRAYRKEREFTLGGALTVLYGPNGFGKTSFFDALDFVATGEIGRLTRRGDHLGKVAAHLDSSSDNESLVTLSFTREGALHRLTRRLSSRNMATLNESQELDRKAVLACLTGAPTTDRVENLISLFRATHLFSQDNQALAEDFHGTSELSAELVSRMLAFEDYVIGIKKAIEVCDAARSIVARASGEAKRAREAAAKESVEFRRLSAISATGVDSLAVGAAMDSLNRSLHAFGIVAEGTHTVEGLRNIRLRLEQRIAVLDAQVQRIRSARVALATKGALLDDAATFAVALQQASVSANDAAQLRTQAQAVADAAATKVATIRADLMTSQVRLDALSWIVSVKPQFDELTSQHRLLDARYQAAAALLTHAQAQEQLTAAQVENALKAHEAASALASSTTLDLGRLSHLVEQASKLGTLQLELKRVRTHTEERTQSIAQHRMRTDTSRATIANIDLQMATLEAQVSELRAKDSELATLVSQLRRHVADGRCVFCSHNHGSTDSLLKAVDSHRPQSPNLQALVDELHVLQEKRRLEELRVTEELVKLDAAERELAKAENERTALEGSLRSLTEAVAGFGIQFLGEADASEPLNRQLQEKFALQLELQRQQVLGAAHAAERLEEARRAHALASTELERAMGESTTLKSAVFSLREEVFKIASDVRATDVSFSTPLAVLEATYRDAEQSLRLLKQAYASAQNAVEESKRALEEADARMSSTLEARDRLAMRKSAADEQIGAVNRQLLESGFSADVSEADIDELVARNSSESSGLSQLLEKSRALEIALDAATTAASMQSIRAKISEFEETAAKAEQMAADHEPWAAYFAEVADSLRLQQEDATRNFTEQYGPRAEVIQRRLRPVYGFESVRVSSQGSGIAVSVGRNGLAYRPSDYFSQSQVQTLLLGLFLAACSSQTWSGFSAVLMDDPVTHFDDLNTYALLDLLSGLLKTPEGGLQFLISTCDEKLLLLARQRFRHLGDAAKFYRFSAIGSDGPMVAEIPN